MPPRLFGLIVWLACLFFLTGIIPTYAQSTPFIAISDLHFDPFISCTKKPCNLIQKLRAAKPAEWDALLANADTTTPTYGADTNYSLFISFLNHAQQTAAINHVVFVVLLGDVLGHNFQDNYEQYSDDKSGAHYRKFVKRTMEFIALKLKQTFPTTDVYMAVGNNDSYDGDYNVDFDGKFFPDMATIWGSLINDQYNQAIMQKAFAQHGYYAVTIPGSPNLRLIVMNSAIFSDKANGNNLQQAAQDELTWLQSELSTLPQNQKAIILMHVPVGINVNASLSNKPFSISNFWSQDYTSQFQTEMQQYANNIAGIMTGHVHMDWFQIFANKTATPLPSCGIPAIGPKSGNNPAYKLFYFNDEGSYLEDAVTYYAPLNGDSAWDREYDFNILYQPNCQHCKLIDGMKLLSPNNIFATLYTFLYDGGACNQAINSNWIPYYWCAIYSVSSQDYTNCLVIPNN